MFWVAGCAAGSSGNGLVDDIEGWNFAENTNVIADLNGHGTHVAGELRFCTEIIGLMPFSLSVIIRSVAPLTYPRSIVLSFTAATLAAACADVELRFLLHVWIIQAPLEGSQMEGTWWAVLRWCH